MKVQQLIAKLQGLPPDTTVLVECGGEIRTLLDDDIRHESDAEVYTDDSDDPVTGDVVLITSWS